MRLCYGRMHTRLCQREYRQKGKHSGFPKRGHASRHGSSRCRAHGCCEVPPLPVEFDFNAREGSTCAWALSETMYTYYVEYEGPFGRGWGSEELACAMPVGA